ncbi:uncharacterized protein LOC143082263 isoform X2 [Mytilus galloprovincialis]
MNLMADKRSIPLFLKMLESGSEKKRDIRLVVVGKKGAGKTSLIKRLFGERIQISSWFERWLFGDKQSAVPSTNGIDIHTIKCKTQCDDGIWKKIDGNYEENDLLVRLLKPYEEKLSSQKKDTNEALHKTMASNTPACTAGLNESKKPKAVTEQYIQIKPPATTSSQSKLPVTNKSQLKSPVATSVTTKSRIKSKTTVKSQVAPVTTTYHEHLPNRSFQQAHKEIKNMLKSKVNLHEREEYAKLLLWDFAGDEEFYHTHQTFLSPDSIYLVVTKLNEAAEKNSQDMFQLWMNSIHCYCTLEKRKNEHESITESMGVNTYMLDPPVVLVCSHKDKIEPSKGENITDACNRQINNYVKNVSDDACRHIRKEYFISNTQDDETVFRRIRQDILNLARTTRSWNKDYPLKFIQLEKRLQDKKKVLQIPIISFRDLKRITTETPMPLNDEELMLYLKFHHEIRALVYFEDLPDFIVLDTQWLSDAFKCIVTPSKFQSNRHKMKNKLDDLNEKGILHSEVIEDIFSNKQNILYEHHEHKSDILNIMKKFDIIIPAYKDGTEEPSYYVPCMIHSKPEGDINEMLNLTADIWKKSTWLCFKFRFLPPNLINHLIASLSRQYEFAEVYDTDKNKRHIALFKDTAVYELQKTAKLRKLLVMTYPNFIQIQILELENKIKRGLYKYIADFVTDEIIKIISTRFKMSNVNFDKMWECGLTKPESVRGLHEFTLEPVSKYYCATCKATHKFKDEWSDLQNELSKSIESNQGAKPDTRSISQHKTIATKVCVLVHGGMAVTSNLSEDTTRTGNTNRFTNEELNFAKMGMIAMNILADVLYDLLKQDKLNVPPRSNCDITFLYSEHRKLNKRIPSNSSHRRCPPGPWGGNWQDIQVTDKAIGDDIERIRLTRNELQHLKTFELDDTRFIELQTIIVGLLDRFDKHIKPANLYTNQLKVVLSKTISEEEVKSIKNEIRSDLTIAVEIEHQMNV